MADDVARKGARGAVGTPSQSAWLRIGELQFDFLISHGLRRGDTLLELGCGNLRAGWRFIEYLDIDRYIGVDISRDILEAAWETVTSMGLEPKRPRIDLVQGDSLPQVADASVDVVHAHSVFTHTPPSVVEAYVKEAARVLKPGGFFDFTFHRAKGGRVKTVIGEDYYYPVDLLKDIGARYGLESLLLGDWTYVQEKMRLTKPSS